ncbi:MAG: c-type cytochrome, partial [Planctomycetaceae bacterium]|nr:c-type cytochrome [Planctomycetaceae bacterium]
RSYLHANCSSCHHPGGNAIVSFYLRRDLPFEKLNTNKGTGIGTFGMKDAKIIVPGDPYRSVLTYRMSKLGYARMPYIGSRVVDSKGVALIEDWIRSMKLQPEWQFSLEQQPEAMDSLAIIQNSKSTRRETEHAVRMLARETEGTLALAGQLHRGTVTPEAHRMAVAVGKSNLIKSDIRGLLETFVPEAERRPTLGPNIQPQTILDLAGDASRGKLIFFSDSARCRNCHDLSDREKSIGPTLFQIRKKYAKRSEMLQHILQPSLKVEEAFSSYIVLTNSGKVYTGLLVKQDKKGITLKTAEKKLIRIPRDEIEVMRKSEKSLMPDRILSDLTAQEAADLLGYLLSLEVKTE